MYTFVTRAIRRDDPSPFLPFYPHAVMHYQREKDDWTAYREVSRFVSLIWLINGEIEVEFYEKKHILHKNDVIFYVPGDDFICRILNDCEYRGIQFGGERAAGHILSYRYKRIIRGAGPCPVELFQQIMEHLSDTDPFMLRMIVSWIDQILACAGGRYDNTVHSGRCAERAKEIIETQFGNSEININTICDMVGCSRIQLERLFRREFNRLPGEYLSSTRMVEAGALLRGTDLPVSEIAGRCGIPNLNTFCRFVKRISGFTPSEFRKRRGVD